MCGSLSGWCSSMIKRWTVLLLLLDLAFFAALLAVPVIWLMNPLRITWGPLHVTVGWGIKPVAAVFALLAARGLFQAAAKRRGAVLQGLLEHGLMKKLILSLVMTYACFAIVEGALILVKFRVNMAPVVFALDNAEGVTEVTQGFDDPELRWKFRKGEKYHGRMINSLGYREREVDPVKAPGTIRIICLGDSVTAQGEPGYSQLLHDRLNANPPTTNRWECFNMAVYGYSSMQGLRVFQLEAVALKPDFVTIYFGWNDHWLEMETDRTRMAVKVHPLYGRVYNKLKEKRIFMLLSQLMRPRGVEVQSRERAGFRVPPDEYVEVLKEFVSEVRAAGAVPILITAARREVYPSKDKFPEESRKVDYNQVHDQYVELTRQAARETGAELVDLQEAFAGSEHDGVFMKDGIHFKQSGLELIAGMLNERIRKLSAK